MQAEQLTAAIAHHAEGAMWDARSGRVLWVDMLAGRVLSTDPLEGTTIAMMVESPVAAMVRPTGERDFIVARRTDVCILRADGSLRPFASVVESPDVAINEGGCDTAGRLLVGSVADDGRPGAGHLWQVSGNGQVRVLLDGISCSNGLAFSEDGTSMFYVDTGTERVDCYAYDVATGELGPRRALASIPELGLQGVPDGICMDAEGGVWVALWGGRSVVRVDAAGRLDAVVEIPTLNVTSCAFGGADLRTLFVTTSAYDNPGPEAGALFACAPGVTGRPVNTFVETP